MTTQDDVVPGELWEVDDAGLDALDVLEGVDEGMYTRVELDVEVWWKTEHDQEATQEHDATFSEKSLDEAGRGRGRVVSAFGYMTGPASLALGVGRADSCRAIGAYSLEVHEAEYVPKHRRAAGSLGTAGVRDTHPPPTETTA